MFTEEKNLLRISLLAALVLAMLPFPVTLVKPYWVALVVIYWVLESGYLRRLEVVFALGLLLDLLTGTLMGQHALSLLIITYLLLLFRQRIRFYPPWQMTLVVFVLLLNDRILQLWVLWLAGQVPNWQYWISPLLGAAVWPWLFLLLDRMRSRQRQRQN